MTNERATILATLIVFATGAFWGFYWLPVRALTEIGLKGAWGTAAITGTAVALLIPVALRNWQAIRSAGNFLPKLCRFFLDHDCSLTEINPLVVTEEGELVALDAKVSFDDNALFRHKDLKELRDVSEEDEAEVRAGEAGLSYVNLDGNIGCLVNGAGLAMSTISA